MTIVIEVSEIDLLVAFACILLMTILWLCVTRKKRSPSVKTKAKTCDEDPPRFRLPVPAAEPSRLAITDCDSEDKKEEEILGSFDTTTPIDKILQSAVCISRGSPSVYKLPVKLSQKVTTGIEKCEVGIPHLVAKPTKVFMVVGATGAGKSTLINCMVNYLLGVKFEDDYLFKLITEEAVNSQTDSQTQKITSYTIYWQEGSSINYNLTIVDTPGFGDTRGLQRDRQITAQIKQFFSLKGDEGIDQIDGIGFVIQSSLARLTVSQKYIFDAVLSIFGKDIQNSIFIISTFADGSEPAVKGAIETGKVPFCKFLQFNNGPIFERRNKYSKMFWDMAYESFEQFFMHFTITKAVSLQLTREVLKERQQLESIVTGLQKRIQNQIAKIDELNQEKQVLKMHEADILKNKNFKYEITVFKQRKVDINKEGIFVTNCQRCNFTCHYPCSIPENNEKINCAVMNIEGLCTVCPGNCFWTMHYNRPYYYQTYEENEVRTIEDLRKNFQDASTKKGSVQNMITKLEQELNDFQSRVLADIQQVRKCLHRLAEIALKPNPLTDREYIGLLIQAEISEKKLGFTRRIKYLRELKEQVDHTTKFGIDKQNGFKTQSTKRKREN